MVRASIEPHARFHVPIGEVSPIHHQFQVPNALLLDEKHLFPQAQCAPEANASSQPDLDLVPQRQVDPMRQLLNCHAPTGQPLSIALVSALSPKTEFALPVHGACLLPVSLADHRW